MRWASRVRRFTQWSAPSTRRRWKLPSALPTLSGFPLSRRSATTATAAPPQGLPKMSRLVEGGCDTPTASSDRGRHLRHATRGSTRTRPGSSCGCERRDVGPRHGRYIRNSPTACVPARLLAITQNVGCDVPWPTRVGSDCRRTMSVGERCVGPSAAASRPTRSTSSARSDLPVCSSMPSSNASTCRIVQ